jgi:hypothetical protein
MPKIKDLILKTEKVNWLELQDLQPNNLKTPYHTKLVKESLIKNGFSMSIFVWQDPKTNEIFICDGHTRRDTLVELKSDGFEIPDQLSCTFLDLPNRKTAIRYLLEVFNTKKNPIDETAMIDWIQEEGVEIEEVNIDWLDVLKTVSDDDYSLLDEVDDEVTEGMANEVKKSIQIEFTPQDYERAYELCQYARSKKIYIGEHLINLLQDIKDGYKEQD